MTVRRAFRPLIVGFIAMFYAAAVHPAAAARGDALKAAIDAFLHRIELSSGGWLHWDGADTFDVQANGDAATATLVNAHFSFRKEPTDPKPAVSLTLDRIEISRKPAAQGGNFDDLPVSLPKLSTIVVTDQGREIAVTLKDGSATALLEGPDDRQRAGSLALTGLRVEDKGGKDWAGLGSFTGDWKI